MSGILNTFSIGSRVIYTTNPYPEEVADALQMAGSILGAFLLPVPLEEWDADFTILSATLNNQLLAHDQSNFPEEFNADFAILGAVLDTQLLSHDQSNYPEEFDADFTILGATLNNLLVTITTDAEALEVTGSPLPGTLI